jgi:hypothetical protein
MGTNKLNHVVITRQRSLCNALYLVGYANLTNTRSLTLLGDPDASAYELLFSFPSPEEKNEFLNLARSNEDMGTDYIIELTPLRGDQHS